MIKVLCKNVKTLRYWIKIFDSPYLARKYIEKCRLGKTVQIISVMCEGAYYGE